MLRHAILASAALVAALAAVPSVAVSLESHTAAPGVLQQGPGVYRLQVGAVRVTALSDGTVPQDLHKLLLRTTAAKTDALLSQGFLANPVEASINAFLLEMGDRMILIDTGSGDLFGPGFGGKLGESLTAAGVRPEQVTDILITHVHTDHTGGLVKGDARVFPNAAVHVGKPDVDFFLDRANAEKAHYDAKYFDEATKTLKPYLDAGKLKPFAATTEVVPGITATLHPGHTPGSAFYTLRSGDRSIVFVGDIIHVSSVQFPDPTIAITYDVDPERAVGVRAEQFPILVRDRTLIAAPHLPFPGVGHVRAAGHGFAWVPVDYGNRDLK